jgi:hypothetical protein
MVYHMPPLSRSGTFALEHGTTGAGQVKKPVKYGLVAKGHFGIAFNGKVTQRLVLHFARVSFEGLPQKEKIRRSGGGDGHGFHVEIVPNDGGTTMTSRASSIITWFLRDLQDRPSSSARPAHSFLVHSLDDYGYWLRYRNG